MSDFTSADAAALFRREPERQIEVDVGSVAHRQVGSGPDVQFVHGWPVSGPPSARCSPTWSTTSRAI